MKGFLIAGSASGVGKTAVTLCLIAALRERGLTVQPFKGGPDFLDTGHHTRVSGRRARNVDTWMLSHEENISVVYDAARDADVIVLEGMMGLFDGKSGESEAGSCAEIAKLLKLPVILVVDASKSARSIAAVVLGFELFDSELPLAGVILNRVGSDRHFLLLQAALKEKCRTPVLGWLPCQEAVSIPERHLGLRSAVESKDGDSVDQLNAFALIAEKHLDLETIGGLEWGLEVQHSAHPRITVKNPVRIGVARDAAFSFYYEDNLDLLQDSGAVLVPFSPVQDTELPPALDALYFGGGYPELHAKQISGNESMLAEVRDFAASAKPVYAECGGMIYLGESIVAQDGTKYGMTGVLPLKFEMTSKLVQFGYVTVEFIEDCLLGMAGTVVRGHSFHYSRLASAGSLERKYRVYYSLSGKEEDEGFSAGNVLGSYIHLHFRAAPGMVARFVQKIREAKSIGLVRV
jgi:cobyrinic acid a,c-diamide synthase